MLSIFWDIIESLETFFETTTAGFIGLAFLIIASIATENIVFLIVGLGEFIMFSLFCGIVQLLAGIKHGIDNMK